MKASENRPKRPRRKFTWTFPTFTKPSLPCNTCPSDEHKGTNRCPLKTKKNIYEFEYLCVTVIKFKLFISPNQKGSTTKTWSTAFHYEIGVNKKQPPSLQFIMEIHQKGRWTTGHLGFHSMLWDFISISATVLSTNQVGIQVDLLIA